MDRRSRPLRGDSNARRRPGGEALSRRRFLMAGGVLAGGLVLGGVALGSARGDPTDAVTLFVEKTTRSPGALAPEIRTAMVDLALRGGGDLAPFAVGQRVKPLPVISLTDVRQGETENDRGRLTADIDRRLDALQEAIGHVDVGMSGFDLVNILQVLEAQSRKVDRLTAWLQTTVLTSSSDPLAATVLSSTDPQAAVDNVGSTSLSSLDLSRVDLHIVLVEPTGDDQPPLSIRAQHWRSEFIAGLARSLGAQVTDPLRSSTAAPPWPRSSAAPAILTAESPTPRAPLPDDPSGQPPEVIDTAAFEPDSDALIDEAAVQPHIADMAQRYRLTGARFAIVCTGYCAAFGPPESARTLSAARAAVIGVFLQRAGVPARDVHVAGKGFDVRADATQDPRSPAQRVVIMRFVERGTTA